METGDFLTLIGELAIGVAGFSGIVAALTRRSAGEWRPVDVLRLQMLIRTSIAVAAWAVLPALLLASGLSGAVLWRVVSASWLVLAPFAIFAQLRRGHAQISENPEDTSRSLYVFVIAVPISSFVLQAANVMIVEDAWPHLTALSLGLLNALLLFVRLATVAFALNRPDA